MPVNYDNDATRRHRRRRRRVIPKRAQPLNQRERTLAGSGATTAPPIRTRTFRQFMVTISLRLCSSLSPLYR